MCSHAGAGKGSEIAVTSTLFVETVEKKPGAVATKRFHGDASRVIASGNGLKKGFHGRAANFTLDVKDAGLTSHRRLLRSASLPRAISHYY